MCCSSDIFLGLLALIFPPIAVWVKRGICSADSIINILLCVLGYIPGLLHAWYIIAKYPTTDYEIVPDAESYHYHCNHSSGQSPSHGHQAGSLSSSPQDAGYGAINQQPRPHPAPQAQQVGNGEGPSDGSVPPSYAEVVAGDNKIQH